MGSGYLTDEELELCQTIEQPSATPCDVKTSESTTNNDRINNMSITKATKDASHHPISMNNASSSSANATSAIVTDALASPSVKEVLIGGDNNPSRR